MSVQYVHAQLSDIYKYSYIYKKHSIHTNYYNNNNNYSIYFTISLQPSDKV